MKIQTPCPRCHQRIAYTTTAAEDKELYTSFRLALRCDNCRETVNFRLANDGTLVSEVAAGDERTVPDERFASPDDPQAVAEDRTAFEPSRHPPAPPPQLPSPAATAPPPVPASAPPFAPRGADLPPFEPLAADASQVRKGPGPWQRFSRWFSQLRPWQQYGLIGALFLVALLILFYPSGKKPEKKPDANPVQNTKTLDDRAKTKTKTAAGKSPDKQLPR